VEVLIGDRFHPHGQRHLEAEIAEIQKEIDRQKQKAVASGKRLQKLMKEMGLTDLPKTGNDNQC